MSSVLYFGTPLGALYLLRSGVELAMAVIAPLDCVGLRRLRRERPLLTTLLDPDLNDPSVVRTLASSRNTLATMWYYPKKIPRRWVDKCIGVHPSLLPRWAGADPVHWAIRSGDAVTGVSVFYLGAEYDAGPILTQRALTIHPNDTALSLSRRLDTLGLSLLVEVLRSLETYAPRVQNLDERTYAPQITADDCVIRWNQPAQSIRNLVRASRPYPLASMRWGDHVIDVRAVSQTRSPPHARVYEPGEAVFGASHVCVKAADGWLSLDEVVLENRCYRGEGVIELFRRMQRA